MDGTNYLHKNDRMWLAFAENHQSHPLRCELKSLHTTERILFLHNLKYFWTHQRRKLISNLVELGNLAGVQELMKSNFELDEVKSHMLSVKSRNLEMLKFIWSKNLRFDPFSIFLYGTEEMYKWLQSEDPLYADYETPEGQSRFMNFIGYETFLSKNGLFDIFLQITRLSGFDLHNFMYDKAFRHDKIFLKYILHQIRNQRFPYGDMMYELCCENNFALWKKLFTLGKDDFVYNEAFRMLVYNGNLEAVKYFHKHGICNDNPDMWSWAFERKHFHIVEWAIENVENLYKHTFVSNYSDFKTMKRIRAMQKTLGPKLKKSKIDRLRKLEAIGKSGDLKLVEWAIEKKKYDPNTIYNYAAHAGHLHILKTAKRFHFRGMSIISIAISNYHYDIIKWALTLNFRVKFHYKTVLHIMFHNSLDLYKLLEEHLTFTGEMIAYTRDGKNGELRKWLEERVNKN
jgi:hypothetical protein